MKLATIGLAAAAALALGGCDKTSGKFDLSGAQAIAIKICSFEPTVQTVLNIFNTGSPLLDTAQEVGAAICQAVNTPRGAGTPPVVAGIVVEGKRVR